MYRDTISLFLSGISIDSLALVELYNSTGGSRIGENKTNWLTSSPVSEWYGVTVTAGRVTGLDDNKVDNMPY